MVRTGRRVRLVAQPADDAAADGGTEGAEAVESERLELDVEKILIAVGREPVSDTLDLEAVGVETDERGFIETDSRARTNVDHVFAAGDVAGEPMLAHKGSMEGRSPPR